MRRCELELETHKWQCRACSRSFWQRFPGILPRLREPYRRRVCQKHFDGISRSRLQKREGLSSTTVERWFLWYLGLLAGVLGRSEASLESYLADLPGKGRVKVVCMDLAGKLPSAGAQALSASPHRCRPVPCRAHRQNPGCPH